MKPAFVLLLLSFFLIVNYAFAQKEASVWLIGSQKQFNFQTGSFALSDFDGNATAKSAICDKGGNLLMYTNGRQIWNKNDDLLINGEELIPPAAFTNNAPVFIPYPGKESKYILLYEEVYYEIILGEYQNTLYYAEIDVNANNGRGEVIKQKVKLHNNYHSWVSVCGYCNNSYFWIVVDQNTNVVDEIKTDRIFFYKVGENGVETEPRINDNVSIGNSSGYRFSPNGDKLFFMVGGSYDEGEKVADFNFETGDLYNIRFLDLNLNHAKEFSPDSRFLYFFSGSELVQIDVRYTSVAKIQDSAKVVLRLPSSEDLPYPGQGLQLAPDGKIYFDYYDVPNNSKKMGRINAPNEKGDACSIELNVSSLDYSIPRMPDFVTSFFREKMDGFVDEVVPEAGPKLEICSRSSEAIGIAQITDSRYQWLYDDYLSNPFISQPVFNAPLNYNDPFTLPIVLRTTDKNCWVNFDTTMVTVNPIPEKIPIDGSWSVCPYVKEVDYWTENNHNVIYWLADGGDIVANPAVEKVKINWGDTNLDASVSVYSENSYGCYSDTTVFPVRINVELLTETPNGPDDICIANAKNIIYEIKKTNGSVYDWNPMGGEVIYGQGTNKVHVQWTESGQNRLTVHETSVTIDTVCYGESEPLYVNVVNDSLEIDLQNVSFNKDNNIVVDYYSERLRSNNHSLILSVSEFGEMSDEMEIKGTFSGRYIFKPSAYNLKPEIFTLGVINSCNETFTSNSLQTVVLRGNEIQPEGIVRLSWNNNRFWNEANIKNEIWHSADGKSNWELVKNVGQDTEFMYTSSSMSLLHYFKIKETNTVAGVESWSNTIEVEIEGNLIIPDVFTPNGDGINDKWEIGNIDFYPFQKVVIYNRYGQIVYTCEREYVPWDGKIDGKIIQGTYMYQLIFDSSNKKYGQVTILR
ncbi:T9SS type B sorting domain-containing protein [Maribellus maritimus]|uniref:T9SS type B sorting domain-containing protein n=1 Tax=Maribellus maritimus TaxID=2870838 RepID=UPI001EEC3282|nr:gliding motility-associated C-terminal domain-containing protein [Maribellus maritimus]MCG6189931.1 gliding motility-associated C-terminal domain-containing protein [Maribellus maritimus]